MKTITLTQNQVALVDDEDHDYLNQFKWCAHKNHNGFYAVRSFGLNGKKMFTRMHNEVMQSKSIDHIDGNGLNNQRSNLRQVTQQQNITNSKKMRTNRLGNAPSSIYKGVHFDSRKNKYRARIRINKILYSLGSFIDPMEAAKAYDKKAFELYGNFAKLNFKK